MKANYQDPVTFYYDGQKISKKEAISKMVKAGCDNHVQRCTMRELLNENAEKGDERAIELLKHMTMTDSREAEVGYLVYVDGWSKGQRYVWDAAEIEDGGLCDCPNGYDDLFDTREEAEHLKKDVEDYIKSHDYILTVGIEEVVKS